MSEEMFLRLVRYLNKESSWIKGSILAQHLGVTTRTLRTYIKSINVNLDVPVIHSSELGYKYNPASNYLSIQTEHISFEKKANRINYIIKKLCTEKQALSLLDLEDTLFISSTSLEKDLKIVQAVVESFSARYVREKKFIHIICDENIKRRIIAHIFFEETAQTFISVDVIEDAFDIHIKDFYNEFLNILNHHNIYLNEFSSINILVHIIVSVQRIMSNRLLTLDSSIDMPEGKEALASQEITRLIKESFDVEFNLSERNYLTMLLFSRSNIQSSSAHCDEDFIEPTSEDELIQDIICEVQKEFLVNLDDENFVARFSMHISNLIHRVRFNSINKNPLMKQFKNQYPMTYELSVFIAKMIENRIGTLIEEDEIAFIAFHIAAFLEPRKVIPRKLKCLLLCPEFHDLQTILKSKLLENFQIHLSEVIVSSQLGEDYDVDCDFIVSTYPSSTHPNRPVIIVDSFLKQRDLDNIYKLITTIINTNHLSGVRLNLLQLFRSNLFERNHYFKNEFEAIEYMFNKMSASHITPDDYYLDVIDREKMSSTAFNNIIAVPHSMKMNANHSAIFMIINDKPMKWGEENVQVIVAIAMNQLERKLFIDIYDQFIEVISDISNIHKMLDVKNYSNFISILSEIIFES